MDLTRVGGKDDGGVDLMGWWWLPEDLDQTIREGRVGGVGRWRRIRVLAQCKAETKKIGPNVVRELEGVLHRFQHPPSPSSDLWTSGSGSADVVAVLVSQSLFTSSTLVHAYSSPLPLFLLHVPVLPPPTPPPPLTGTSTIIEAETRTGRVGGAFWNAALAGEKGVFRGKMELRWERGLDEHGRPGLWWEGTRVRTVDVESPLDVSDPPYRCK
jgi:hypothetical protein